METITLSQCPKILQNTVLTSIKYQQSFVKECKILSVTKENFQPYHDQTVIVANYRIILQVNDSFTIYHYFVDPKSDDLNPTPSSITIGDIKEIMKCCPSKFN